MKTPSQKIVVIYHGDCPDGFGGAYAAWKKFGSKAAYISASGWSVLPCSLSGKEIYLIDYTYNDPALIKKLMRDNVRVTAIDHHITAEQTVKLTQDYSFALNHSGAVLAWKYFHPGKKVPMMLRYIEDRDIWRWKVPSSKAVLAYFDLNERSFVTWDRAAKDLEQVRYRKIYKEKGELLLRYEKGLLDNMMQGARMVRFAGHAVFAINAPRRFADDLANAFARKTHSFAIVWRETSGMVKVSLRSDGSVDVSRIAKKFGGGGHKNASAFSFAMSADGITFPWKAVKDTALKSRAKSK